MRALCSGLSAHAVFAALTCQAQLVGFIRRRAPSGRHGGGAKQGTAWLAAGCLGDLTTQQRDTALKAAITGEDEPYAGCARAS
jgi:hypothetical protein